ncbi:MAG: GDP-L-fucose synthase family protein [Candidatus Thorarchaeota archaeon]|jgi:GDP-L-fucose synthase
MDTTDAILVAGYRGMVGSTIVRALNSHGYNNILKLDRDEIDLRKQNDVEKWFGDEKPQHVILAAAIVGGIQANIAEPARFMYDNLMIQTNVIHSAYKSGVEKLLFLGSSCIYPRLSEQPMKEDYMLTGLLEPTNEAYALAKIAGLKMCEYYHRQYGFNAFTIIPPNLYGPGDDFSIEKSHVVAALLRRFHEAKVNNSVSVALWGTGIARREFMYVEDLADAVVFLMNNYDDERFINVGTGDDVSILELAEMIRDVTGYQGKIELDPTKPDGMPRKLMDSSRFQEMEWSNVTDLKTGLKRTYEWFLENKL